MIVAYLKALALVMGSSLLCLAVMAIIELIHRAVGYLPELVVLVGLPLVAALLLVPIFL